MFAIPFLSLVMLGSAFTERAFSAPTNSSMLDAGGKPPTHAKLIVTMKEGATSDVLSNSTIVSYGQKVEVINGFIVDGSEVSVDQLRADPNVFSVEEDQIVNVTWNEGNDVGSNHKRGHGHGNKHGHGHPKHRHGHHDSYVTRNNAPWGLARLTSRGALKKQDPQALDYEYRHFEEAGQGVDVYVIDTGVRTTHDEFGDRARWGATFGNYADADGGGYGTHSAGIVAGNQFGVANHANIIAVKVLSDEGWGHLSDVIAGMDWINTQVQCTGNPSVVSMSIGGPQIMDVAVMKLIENNIHVIVSAGNNNDDAKNFSPAHLPQAITVGAMDIYDTRLWYSNYGPLVDIHAPGVGIISSWASSDTATSTGSGTGQATPYIAGLVAYIISLKGNMSPATMSKFIKNWGVKDVLTNIPDGTANLIAHIKEEKPGRHGHHH